MKKFLNDIRMPNKNISLKKKIINTLLVFFFGILLGIVSKWLDNLSINDSIWWQYIIDVIDLKNVLSSFSIWLFIALLISVYSKTPLRSSINVFLFFVGMTISYHLYTILFSGFNPKYYMMIWYTLTVISPFLAYICWYAKADSKISIVISALIISVMIISCFSIGSWYLYLNSIIDLLIFIGVIFVLYIKPKNTLFSLAIGTFIAYLIRLFI